MPPPSSAAKFLTTTINAATGEIVDVDDAAGLKAALARVQNTVLEAEAQVVAIVEEEHEAIASTLNTAEELRAQLSSLEALMAAVPCDALRRELEETVLRVPTLRASRDAARAEHARFSLLAEVHELRETFEAAMVEQELGAATKHLLALRALLPRLEAEPELKGGAAPLLDELTEEMRTRQSQLEAAALAAWASAALGHRLHNESQQTVFYEGSGAPSQSLVLRVGPQGHLPVLADALNKLGLAERCCRDLGDALMARLVRPVLEKHELSVTAAAQSDESQVLSTVAATRSDGDDGGGGLVARAEQVCAAIEVIVCAVHRFLQQAATAEQEPLRLRADFWSELRRAVVDDCLLPALELDRQANIVDVCAAVASRVEGMRTRLHEALGAAAIDGQVGPLVEAAKQLQVRAVGMRCATILEEGRGIILDETADNLEGVLVGPSLRPWEAQPENGDGEGDGGDGGLSVMVDGEATASTDAEGTGPARAGDDQPLTFFLFPRCRVTRRVLKLLTLLHDTIEYACVCGPDGAALLYSRARELIDLFTAVTALKWQAAELAPSSVRASGIALVPTTALLLHNDALLLRHRCLTFGIEYAPRLPPPLGGRHDGSNGAAAAKATFVEMAPELGRHAQRALKRVLSQVRSQLILELMPGKGFNRVGEDADAGSAASMVARRLSYKLKQLARVWADTLSVDQCCDLLSDAIEAPMGELASQLLQLRHISERDSVTLQGALLLPILSVCAEVLLHVRGVGGGSAAPPPAADEPASPLSVSVPPPSPGGTATAEKLLEWEAELRPSPSLRKVLQLAWLLGASTLWQIRERHAAGELTGLRPKELQAALRAVFDHAALVSDEEASKFMRTLDEEERELVAAEERR